MTTPNMTCSENNPNVLKTQPIRDEKKISEEKFIIEYNNMLNDLNSKNVLEHLKVLIPSSYLDEKKGFFDSPKRVMVL